MRSHTGSSSIGASWSGWGNDILVPPGAAGPEQQRLRGPGGGPLRPGHRGEISNNPGGMPWGVTLKIWTNRRPCKGKYSTLMPNSAYIVRIYCVNETLQELDLSSCGLSETSCFVLAYGKGAQRCFAGSMPISSPPRSQPREVTTVRGGSDGKGTHVGGESKGDTTVSGTRNKLPG
eukprot:1190039-Prorocentrum_minimum.AAC.1